MDENISEEYLSKARSIITQVESGNIDEAGKLIEEWACKREESLFQDLGKLTREFHEALNGFKLDSKLTTLTGNDIPDARERLKHVIEVTEKSAHKTMSVVEDLTPLCETLGTQSEDIHDRWKRFMKQDMDAKESRVLCEEVQVYLAEQSSGTNRMRAGLNEILMAQDYQDITGQIISRVINLVTDLETSLVKLIKDSGEILDESKQVSTVGELDGPQVPGLESSDAVSGQDEVDDLLSSLGF